MDLTPVKTPGFIKFLFPKLTWNIPTREKVLYLTFDDGPTPEVTDWTLDILRSYHAKATFFCIGKNIAAFPELFQRIIAEGHAVGNHTYNHLKGWNTPSKDYLENINKAQEEIAKNKSQIPNSKFQRTSFENADIDNLQSKPLHLFRPPYGRIRPGQASQIIKLGYKVVMWSVLAKDWEHSLPKEKCLNNITENALLGDIIALHDSVKAADRLKYVLPEVLAQYSQKGYQFKRIPE